MHLRNQYRGLDIDEVSLSERPRFQESEQLSSSVSFPRDSLKKLTLSYSCFARISSPIHSIAVLSSLLEKGGKDDIACEGCLGPLPIPLSRGQGCQDARSLGNLISTINSHELFTGKNAARRTHHSLQQTIFNGG